MWWVGARCWHLSRNEVACFVVFFITLAVVGAVWVSRALVDINDNKAAVCAVLTVLAVDRRSDGTTFDQLSSRAQNIFEQAELGRDRRLAELVGAYGAALSSRDPTRIQRVEASFTQRCDGSTDH